MKVLHNLSEYYAQNADFIDTFHGCVIFGIIILILLYFIIQLWSDIDYSLINIYEYINKFIKYAIISIILVMMSFYIVVFILIIISSSYEIFMIFINTLKG